MNMSKADRPSFSDRSEFIQSLRFVAATLVLLTHSTFYYHQRINKDWSVWWGGVIGVEIFFIISGVVIVMCSATLPFNTTGAKEFMIRRLLRIVPLYWLVLLIKVAVTLVLPSIVYNNSFDAVHAIKSFLFIPTFNAAGGIRPIHGVGWTLQHEMFFYLLFGAMMLLGKRPARWVSAVIIGLVCVGVGVTPQSAPMLVITNPINLYFIVGMMIGSIIVHGGAYHPSSRYVLLAGLILAALLKWLLPEFMKALPLVPVALVFGALMLLLTTWRLPRPLHFAVVLGNSSYTLYLFHPLVAPPVLLTVHRIAAPLGPFVEITLTVTITITLAHGIYKWVELPLNRGIKSLFQHRSSIGKASGFFPRYSCLSYPSLDEDEWNKLLK
jgi:peptidoglycan/LPS O-acetylase OafA/YrhL